MRYEPARCPEHDTAFTAVCEIARAEEGLDYNEEKQEYERNGDCTTHEEGYEEEVDSEGRVKVWCPEGHEVWVQEVGRS